MNLRKDHCTHNAANPANCCRPGEGPCPEARPPAALPGLVSPCSCGMAGRPARGCASGLVVGRRSEVLRSAVAAWIRGSSSLPPLCGGSGETGPGGRAPPLPRRLPLSLTGRGGAFRGLIFLTLGTLRNMRDETEPWAARLSGSSSRLKKKRLSATDILAPATMKNAAKCDT